MDGKVLNSLQMLTRYRNDVAAFYAKRFSSCDLDYSDDEPGASWKMLLNIHPHDIARSRLLGIADALERASLPPTDLAFALFNDNAAAYEDLLVARVFHLQRIEGEDG